MTRAKQQPVTRFISGTEASRSTGVYSYSLAGESSSSGSDRQWNRTSGMAYVKGWQVVARYHDTNRSDSNPDVEGGDDRPEFARLLRDAAAGTVEAVIIWSLDRLGHDIRSVLERIAALEQLGVALVVCKEGIDTTTPLGEIPLRI